MARVLRLLSGNELGFVAGCLSKRVMRRTQRLLKNIVYSTENWQLKFQELFADFK